MNKTETTKILAYLKAAYPNAYGKLTAGDIDTMLNLWTLQFNSYDFKDVYKAVNEFIAIDCVGFVPTIGQIKNLITVSNNKYLNQFEAWELVHRAMCKGDSVNEFNKLPLEVQRTLGNARVLQRWGLTDLKQLSYIEANFKKEYREVLSELDRETKTGEVTKAIECASDKKLLENGGKNAI